MELHIQSILIFLCVAIVGSHAALIGSKKENEETTIGDGSYKKVHIITNRKLVADNALLRKGHAHIKVGPGEIEVSHGPNYVHVTHGTNPFTYHYKGNNTTNPGRSLFFLKKDMKPGHQMTMNFTQSTNEAVFLPKEKARSLPFSTDKMPKILHEFSMQPGSEEAQIIEETIKECESEGIPGEQKYCATCLEDMIDYAKSILGKSVKAISTEDKDGYNKGQKYMISHVIKVAEEGGVLVCHKQNYAYAVYYCHKTKDTSPHIVSLINEHGNKAKVVVVCHEDTSGWNPGHMAFQVLNVKPGSLPICHFLPKDHVAWVRN